jgi:UDP-GlcNAc:undecaprenyl-phosphate/decaprenyl-phosphate GlcNAc-1-phosphate transferase
VLLDAFFSREFLQTVAGHLLPAAFPFLLALLAALVLTPLAMLAGRRLRVVAWPGGRHIHAQPTPKLGGLALYAAFALGVLWYNRGDAHAFAVLILTGACAIAFVYDDRYGLRPALKLGLDLVLALAATLGFSMLIGYVTLPVLGVVQLGVLALPLSLFWLLGMMNTTNLLDGVDGLAAGVVAIVALVLGVAATSRGQTDVTLMSFALAGACLGFLVFNFNPARIFMGDSGSHFLGLALGLLSILGVAKVAVVLALVIPVLALAIPIADTAWAIVRRRRQGMSIAHPDSRHIHHQLLDFGLNQRQTCAVFYLATAILGCLGLMVFGHKRILAVAIVLLLVGFSTLLGEWLQKQPWRLPAPGLDRLLGDSLEQRA